MRLGVLVEFDDVLMFEVTLYDALLLRVAVLHLAHQLVLQDTLLYHALHTDC